MSHYQIKRNEYGQICLRAPHNPEAEGYLFRQNQWGLRSATGYFGQVIRFPATMQEWNTHIEYRTPDGIGGWLYFIGQIPTLTQTWQYITYDQITEPDAGCWKQRWELPREDMDWFKEMEYDLDLLVDTVPAAPQPDQDFAAWLNESLAAITKIHEWFSLTVMAAELGVDHVYLAKVINGEEIAPDFFMENARALVAMYIAQE